MFVNACTVTILECLSLKVPIIVLQPGREAKDEEYDNDIGKPQNLCEYFVLVTF